jgi:hypothetical protein
MALLKEKKKWPKSNCAVSYNTKKQLVLENSAQIPLPVRRRRAHRNKSEGFSFGKGKKIRLKDDDARVSAV